MSSPWHTELRRLAALIILMLLAGLLSGHALLFLGVAAMIYAGWHLWNLYRLDRWLQKGKKYQPPEAPGIWGEVFYQFYRLQQRNRKRKRKLTNMLKRFRESTTAMPDAAVVLDSNYRIEWYNRAAEQLLNLKLQDVGQYVANLIRHPQFMEYLHNQQQQMDNPDYSIKLLMPQEPQLVLRIHLVPYAKRRYLMMARDVTELHRLEQIRRDFVANVSHELRTPLTVLNGFLETLSDGEDECSRQWQRPLALMSQQTTRMQNIVNDLLLLSRLESETAPVTSGNPVDVAHLLRMIQEEARLLSGDQAHKFSVEADARLLLQGHETELRSAFGNLVVNAVRYTPAGGDIILRWYADAQGAHFEVEDTGEGIEEKHLPRLTERFYRVDVGRSRSQGGTGLGLAIVKHVLNRHRGQLRIQSKLGEGSLFACDFPSSLIHHQEAGPEDNQME